MINQIAQDNANKNVFAPLQSSGASYAIIKPFTDTQKIEVKQEEEKKTNKLGYKIAKITLITGFGVFAIMKGMPKSLRTKMNELLKSLEEKTIKLKKNKNLSNLQNFYLKFLRKTKSLANYSKALFNTAPLKDILVKKSLEKSPFFERISNRITNLFEKISVKTSDKSYSKTLVLFDEMYANFAKVNKKSPPEKAQEIEEMICKLQSLLPNGFGKRARDVRLEEMNSGLEGIDKRIMDRTYNHFFKFIRSKSTYQTFLSEEEAAKTKIELIRKVNSLRAKITNDVDDYYNATRKIINQIDTFIDYTDPNSKDLIEKIKQNLSNYKKSVNAGKKNKSLILDSDFSTTLSELNTYISKSKKYDEAKVKKVSEYIGNINNILVDDKKGLIQDILYTYKDILPEKEYRQLKKDTYKAVNSLHKSIDTETDKLFDKIRDLKIGSAPTDVIGVLSSVGIVGYELSKAKDKDERISVTVKYGVPAVGAVLISLYCTLGLISAGPSLLIGLISGLAMNKIGEVLDKKRKEYKEKPPALLNSIKIKPKLKEKPKSV